MPLKPPTDASKTLLNKDKCTIMKTYNIKMATFKYGTIIYGELQLQDNLIEGFPYVGKKKVTVTLIGLLNTWDKHPSISVLTP